MASLVARKDCTKGKDRATQLGCPGHSYALALGDLGLCPSTITARGGRDEMAFLQWASDEGEGEQASSTVAGSHTNMRREREADHE